MPLQYLVLLLSSIAALKKKIGAFLQRRCSLLFSDLLYLNINNGPLPFRACETTVLLGQDR